MFLKARNHLLDGIDMHDMEKHICLLIHCLKKDFNEKVLVHEELFIHLKDIEDMLNALAKAGYKFTLPMKVERKDVPTCSLTFDDGYFNNSYFLDLADKYAVPFVLFVTSFNIRSQIPFLWDVWEATRSDKLHLSHIDYREFYEHLEANRERQEGLMLNDNHRPFNDRELGAFACHPFAHLALHTHTHQPLIGKYTRDMHATLEENVSYLKNFMNPLLTDLSLPCGLYTNSTLKILLKRFKRIYTINGGGFSASDRVINRISLVNPIVGGDLMTQIKKSFKWTSIARRKIVNIRYSNNLFSRI